MNLTPQRVAIYRTLLESTDHPTPEVLFSRVQPQMASLSLATIYKTLEALTRLHLVAELPRGDSSTDLTDDSGEFHAGYLVVHDPRVRIQAADLQQVGSVQRRGGDVDEDLVRTDLGIIDLLDQQGFRTVMGVEDNSAHDRVSRSRRGT